MLKKLIPSLMVLSLTAVANAEDCMTFKDPKPRSILGAELPAPADRMCVSPYTGGRQIVKIYASSETVCNLILSRDPVDRDFVIDEIRTAQGSWQLVAPRPQVQLYFSLSIRPPNGAHEDYPFEREKKD